FPKFTALKREKQQLMQERGKVSEERKTLRDSIKGMEDAYKVVEKQKSRQFESQRTKRRTHDIE
ncbi:MAG: hypothetical protein MJ077_11635, partial [Oscillospiraceae bacterium]|nr:hypothetical protein [Oscillospiraceae bacterium]